MAAWNSLEVSKLIVSAVTPIALVGLGVLVSRTARRLENADWANRELIEKRLALYNEMAPLLNELYCFFRMVGSFRDITPPGAITLKRKLDKIFFVNLFLMDKEFSDLYHAFMESCFDMYTGWGQDAKLRADKSIHRVQRKGIWDKAWDDHFVTNTSKMISPGTIEVRYEELMHYFACEIGVGGSSDT